VKTYYGIAGPRALHVLRDRGGFSADQAKRILDIARTHTYDAEPVPGGILHIRYRGNVSGRRGSRLYEFEWDVMTPEEQARFNRQRKGLPPGKDKVYTQEEAMPGRDSGKAKTIRQKGRQEMPPRKNTKPAPAPAPAAQDNGDLATAVEKALNKETFSATMSDYLDWFTDNVADPASLAEDLDRLMVMTLQFYGPFQRSDFNKTQREARAAERGTPEPEEPAKPARGRGRTTATAPAGKPATAGKAPARRSRKPATAASGSTPY
jgi:hypothetical protein